jgi:L-histidine Nalpha-methyltransferase
MNYTKENVLSDSNSDIENHIPNIGKEKVVDEILKGLKSNPKYISPKYFYNKKGSELFEEITKLDEYYPTRTEKSILSTIADKINIDFTGISIIELGSGDASKIRILIRQIPKELLITVKYYPIDISQSAIEKSSMILANEFPLISIKGIVADFIHQKSWVPKANNKLFCFFGSTIGNMNIAELKEFMELIGSIMNSGDSLLLGMDMVKDFEILEKAYNDERHITAKFNKNILNVTNELIGTNFNPDEFQHLAFYDKEKERVEMHLKAKKDIVIKINSEAEELYIKSGETIHTENSYKFNEKDIKSFGNWAGLNVENIHTDNYRWFSLVHYKKT